MSGSYYPNYAWVGAPVPYNGTGGDGGDSGK
jgi:ammonium transporter, Amt family